VADFSVVHTTRAHLPAIARIYAAAAADTWATFDLVGHPVSWWEEALAAVDPARGHWLLSAVSSDDGSVIGYAKSGRHKEKPAYDSTVEVSIYIDSAARRGGVGGALYDELLARLDEGPARLAVAGIALPNNGSIALHVSRGFEPVGVFREVGVKLGRVWDVEWYQRRLANPAAPDA
jgi:phosphinothricin acetyltransferase